MYIRPCESFHSPGPRHTHTIQGQQKSVQDLVAALKQCSKTKDLEGGKNLHSDAFAAGCHTNKYVAASLINMYSKCGSMFHAHRVFECTHPRNAILWTCLMMGYVENGKSFVAMDLFASMDCVPDSFTYVVALKACGKEAYLEKGIAIHKQLKDCGFDSHKIVATTLVDMYSKCRSMQRAQEVFNNMMHKDVVTWNSLIMGYVENGESLVAMELYNRMNCKATPPTYVAVLQACSCLGRSCLQKGMDIHKQVKECGFDSNLMVANALLDMYVKCGSMEHAKDVFEKMFHKDVITWTTLIMGFVERGENSVAMDLFSKMDCEANYVTYVSVLKACENALPTGQWIHSRICKRGLELNQVLITALMDFYVKCGKICISQELFNSMHSPDIVSWTSLVSAYTSLGEFCRVFSLGREIQEAGLQMNGVTFICILMSCSHAGMVDEGMMYFKSMQEQWVNPTLDHYICIVDMLGRANRLDEALLIVNSMPFKPNDVIWRALLGACVKWTNLEIGKVAFDGLVAENPKNAGAYLMMCDIYGKLGMMLEEKKLSLSHTRARARIT